jgi:hypothetical protein
LGQRYNGGSLGIGPRRPSQKSEHQAKTMKFEIRAHNLGQELIPAARPGQEIYVINFIALHRVYDKTALLSDCQEDSYSVGNRMAAKKICNNFYCIVF